VRDDSFTPLLTLSSPSLYCSSVPLTLSVLPRRSYIATPSYLDHRRHRRRRFHEGNEANRRLHRLEKTVEALSHGLILALTQHKSESGGGDVHEELHRPTSPSPSDPDEGEEIVSSDGAEALSRTLAGMGLSEDGTEMTFSQHFLLLSGRLIDYECLQRAPGLVVSGRRSDLIHRQILEEKMITTFSAARAARRREATSHSSPTKTGLLYLGCLAP
jgi:hypothetical protein